jgi:DegV family protein with EDD domain
VSIRIVTDSTADLDPGLAAANGITVVPLSVLFGDEELLDGVDIDSQGFFERLERESVLPTTSQPSAGAFREVYERLASEGATEILSIHVSGKLSGTLDSARQGAQGLEGVRIEFLDSKLTTLALALGVLAAARAVAGGASLDEARDLAASQFRRTHCYFLVDTLEYLRRGGRIGRASEVLGSLLKVKPLLSLQNGEVEPIGRVRTKQKAIDDLLRRAAELGPVEQMMAAHAASPEDCRKLSERLQALAPDAPLVTGEVGPVIGVHAGPGLLALAVVTADESSPASPS